MPTARVTEAGQPSFVPASRWASLIRAGYGAALIWRPRAILQARTGSPPSRRACVICRVLGLRHLAQAAVCGAYPARWLVRAGVAVDLLHAASMVALAGEDAHLRPAALGDSAVAGGFAAVGGVVLRARPGVVLRVTR
jgi:hypothetical protein